MTAHVSHEEAEDILTRFNNSVWNNAGERARYSIPARPECDDDIRLAAYIAQARRMEAALVRLLDVLPKCTECRRPAIKGTSYGFVPSCDEHAFEAYVDSTQAAAVRAAEKAVGE